jgi:hypothetical protein
MLSLAITGSAQALTITPIFDSTITALPTAKAKAIEGAIDAAIAVYEADLKSDAKIEIDFSWGKIDGAPIAGGDASESLSYVYTDFTYAQVESYLRRAAATNPLDIALNTAVANLPAKDPSGLNTYAITEAEAAALGIVSPGSGSLDGYVGFNAGLSYNFGVSGAAAAGEYQLESLAEHEISEVMGRLSGLSSAKPTQATPYDLFRYSAKGKPSFGYGSSAYFSIDGGATVLAHFNASGGGDRGDWLTTTLPNDAFDATAEPGTSMGLSSADLTALDALGWDTAHNPGGWAAAGVSGVQGLSPGGDAPEPGCWALMVSGVGLIGPRLRGRRHARLVSLIQI